MTMKTPMEIRHEGYEALVKALGFVGMLRFMNNLIMVAVTIPKNVPNG